MIACGDHKSRYGKNKYWRTHVTHPDFVSPPPEASLRMPARGWTRTLARSRSSSSRGSGTSSSGRASCRTSSARSRKRSTRFARRNFPKFSWIGDLFAQIVLDWAISYFRYSFWTWSRDPERICLGVAFRGGDKSINKQ